jgi:hypothetical protein
MMQFVTGFLVIGGSLLIIALFFYHLKYIKATKIGLWGVVLTMDILFPLFDALMSHILKIPYESVLFFSTELLDFMAFGITLILFSEHNKILWAIFAIFVCIWISELNAHLPLTGIKIFDTLRYTSLFVCMVVVMGVLVYWLGLFRKNAIFFLKDPFFWITLGWFVFYLLTSTTYMPITKNSDFVKTVIIGDVSLAGVLANICYGIGFWKSKDWVLKGFSTNK